jgi:CrcB protein
VADELPAAGHAGVVRGGQGSWDRSRVLAVAAGAIVGAGLRWTVVTTWASGQFPWPVFVINVTGSLLLGVLMAEEWVHPRARLLLHDVGGIGFCGSLTTFSTFTVEVVDLLRDGHAGTAMFYVGSSVLASVAAVVVGATAIRRARAIALPLEERP